MTTRFRLVFLLSLLIMSVGFMAFAPTALASDAQQTSFTAPRLIVNTSFLNVRTGPGIQYAVLLTVVGGTELPVLGQASDNVWYQVSTVVGVGWVNIQFCVPRGNFDGVPVVKAEDAAAALVGSPVTLELPGQGGGAVAANTSAVVPAVGALQKFQLSDGRFVTVAPGERYRAIINVEAVNVRTEPLDSATGIATLFRDSVMDYAITGQTTDKNGLQWVAIDVPGVGAGWVETPKVTFRLSRASGPVLLVIGTVGMTVTPGGDGGNLPVLVLGREAYFLSFSQDVQYALIQLDSGEQGWVPANSITDRLGTATDEIDLSTLSAPAVVALSVATNGSTTTTEGQGGGQVVSTGLSESHVVVNTGFLNIRSGPGAQYTSVATVPGGAKLLVLGIAKDRVWFLVQGSFGQGWVNSEFVVFRGSIDAVPTIGDVVGILSSPVAVLSGTVNLYAAPGVNFGAIAALTGPIELPIVARTSDNSWLQLSTSLGYGWVLAAQIQVRGDLSQVAVVG